MGHRLRVPGRLSVADRTAAEQPDVAIGERPSLAPDQLESGALPVEHVDGAADDDRPVRLDREHVGRRTEIHLEALAAEFDGDLGGHLLGAVMPAGIRDEDGSCEHAGTSRVRPAEHAVRAVPGEGTSGTGRGAGRPEAGGHGPAPFGVEGGPATNRRTIRP